MEKEGEMLYGFLDPKKFLQGGKRSLVLPWETTGPKR